MLPRQVAAFRRPEPERTLMQDTSLELERRVDPVSRQLRALASYMVMMGGTGTEPSYKGRQQCNLANGLSLQNIVLRWGRSGQ